MDLTDKQYNQIRKILKYNRDWVVKKSKYDRCEWCAISAFKVNYCLRKVGFNPKLKLVTTEMSGCHCFNELNEYIIDVAADQYYEPKYKIVLAKRKYLEKFWYWGFKNNEDKIKISVISGFKNCLKELEQWDEQSPQYYFRKQEYIICNGRKSENE